MREAPIRLRCEYLENPLAIDTARPRLSWWLNDARPAELQTAYQIQAASTAAGLQSGAADLWDTGQVPSGQTVNVEYRGRALTAGDRVWWRVRCYDSDGTPSPWSAAACFELALEEARGWQAAWVGSPLTGSPVSAVPAPVLLRDFDLPRPVAAARLHVAALGSAVAEINGRPVSPDEPLAPWHDLRHRVPYRVYDVTGLLAAGRNRLAVLLGDGDCCGQLAGGRRQRYGERPALCAQLVVELAGGEQVVIATGRDWRWRPSWVLRSDRDAGEEVDGRQFRPGWSRPGDGSDGYPVAEMSVAVSRVPARTPAARVTAEVEPVAAPLRQRDAAGRMRLRYDFGRSLLGRLRVRLRAPRDRVIGVAYGLAVPPDRPDARPDGITEVRWDSAEDRYTCRGDAQECFEPRFACHVFRLVELVVDGEPDDIQVVALEVGSTAAPTAVLRCDHRLLQAFFEAAAQTFRAGLALGPVSALVPQQRRACPADAEAVLTGSAACLDAAAANRDWLSELARAQQQGPLPSWLPPGPDDAECAEATEALLPCLWFQYRCYGDRRLLEETYPVVQRYLQDVRVRWPALIRGNAETPLREALRGTAWYAYALSLAARMAGVLGRLSDLEAYEALGERVREAFRARFLTRDGLLAADDPLGYLLGLELGLLEGVERSAALARLQALLRAGGFHPPVDLRYGALLLEALTLEGRSDLAYQALLQTTAPGWLHPLHAGADLLWDTAGDRPGRLAAGCVAGWLQRFLLGLELDDNLTPEMNAYRRMRVQPRPPFGPGFGAGGPVREASGHLETVHGRYASAWRITEESFELEVQVPGNGSARVILPDGTETLVTAGTHQFSVPRERLDGRAPERAPDDIPVLREISAGH